MSYTPVNWEDSPSTSTPINADNLNIMDKGIADVDKRTTEIETELPKKIKDENSVIGTNHITNGSITQEKIAEDLLKLILAGGGSGIEGLTVETITIGESVNIPVTGVSLDYTSVELEVGQGMQLACSVIPSNATNNAITWSSSDSTKVKVEEGYITALASGNATITAKSVENSSIKASCSVTVSGTETGEETDQTIQFNDLDIQTGLKKKDGTIVTTVNKSNYVEIPYTEGMFVSTNMNPGWTTNYPAVMVYDGSTYNIPEITKDGSTFTVTLTDYKEGSIVYANIYAILQDGVLKTPDSTPLPLENCYYIVGGAE